MARTIGMKFDRNCLKISADMVKNILLNLYSENIYRVSYSNRIPSELRYLITYLSLSICCLSI